MRIAIIGAGAMGCLYGGYLSKSGQDVVLIDHRQTTVDKINQYGVRIDESDSTLVVRPRAALSQYTGTADLVIVLVKTTATSAALADIGSLLTENTLVMTLQNGFGNAEQLASVIPPERILVGTTAHGSQLLEAGHIRHTGSGLTAIGAFGGLADSQVQAVAQLLIKAGFETKVENDVMRLVWQKLFTNVGINALTALLGLTNGAIIERPEIRMQMRDLVFEAVAVAGSQGYVFDPDEIYQQCLNVAARTAANRSSMLQDVSRGRMTEIRQMNGIVADLGERSGIPVSCNRDITRQILALEKRAIPLD